MIDETVNLTPDNTKVTLSPTAQKLAARYPLSPSMQSAARTFLLKQRIAKVVAAGRPQTGPFYWVPKPAPNKAGFSWEILSFYDDDYGGYIGHDKAWNEVLEHLAIWWQKNPRGLKSQLNTSYTGVPRGRVVKMQGSYGIAHGGDQFNQKELPLIRRLYSLPPNPHVYVDEHERMIAGDPETFQRALGIKTGHIGVDPFADEFDDDYEDVA